MTTPKQQALWYTELLRRCLSQTDDVDEAVRAADMAFAIEPMPKREVVSVELAHDIYNRQAQGILNRAMRAAKMLGRNARDHLTKALQVEDPNRMLLAIIKWVEVYRAEMATLLTTTQLAALLEGAREVAKKIPAVPMFPHANPPATLEPKKAMDLLDRLKELTPMERDGRIIRLPPDQQQFIRQGLMAREQGPPLPPLPFEPRVPLGENPDKIHFPIIDEAAQELAAKNVMTRSQFDALDASARQKAFTIASVDADETLEAVRDELARNIAEGADLNSFRQSVLKTVDESTFLSEWHLENVFRTNVQTAFSDGQMVVLNHPFVRSGFPYARYDAIRDDRARHDHLEMEKYGIGGSNIYRVNDPVFQLFRPPWAWACRCSWTPITVRQAAEDGVEEAQRWLDTGVEPTPPAFVDMPPFAPPPTFRRSLSGAPLSVQLSSRPISIEMATKTEKGRWITIGGSKGSDGKNHGGSPVYIENGRITKGHPSLTGKKLGNLKGESEQKTHRQEMNREKEYVKAKYAKKAREFGVDAKSLHSLADDMIKHDAAHVADVKSLLQQTREAAKKLGVPIHHKQLVENGDHTNIKGFDTLSRSMAGQFPQILGAHGYGHNEGYDVDAEQASEKLYALLLSGNPEPIGLEKAYDDAIDFLSERQAASTFNDDVPFSLSMDLDELRRYRKDKIKGGKADNRPDSDFEATALAKGIRIEMEHTNDPDLAKEIAKDHLTESPRYYDELEKMEKVLSLE